MRCYRRPTKKRRRRLFFIHAAATPAGFVPPPVETNNKVMATNIGATMWFWLLYRAKQDGGALRVRPRSQRAQCGFRSLLSSCNLTAHCFLSRAFRRACTSRGRWSTEHPHRSPRPSPLRPFYCVPASPSRAAAAARFLRAAAALPRRARARSPSFSCDFFFFFYRSYQSPNL